MAPIFRQKYRFGGRIWPLIVTLSGFVILAVLHIGAISSVVSSRALTQASKFLLISLLLVTALAGLGLLNKAR